MSTRAQTQQAKEIYTTIAAIKGQQYARLIKYHVSLLYVAKMGRDKVAVSEMKNMVDDLAEVWGIDLNSPDYLADLASITHTLGVTP